MVLARVAVGVVALVVAVQVGSHAQPRIAGVQDVSWSPDGKRIAISYLNRIWTLGADGRHLFQKIGRKGEVRYGYAAAITIDFDKGLVEGRAEPRRSHAAVAAPR
jgi:hypothetical protein